MNHRELPVPRRRFLVSALSLVGCAFSLGSLALISGCSDDKGPGQLENPGDVTKTPDAQDSMKASMENYQKRGVMPKKK
jgi:hypothetical protein